MAHTRKLPSGRWQGIAKEGRTRLGTKTFDRKTDALAWAERLEASAVGGLDVKAGKALVRNLLPEWLEHREHTVSAKTYRTDSDLLKLVDAPLGARQVASIKRIDIERWMQRLRKAGHSYATVARRRDSMAAFFKWLIEDHRITANPVKDAKQPRRIEPEVELNPFTEDELAALVSTIRKTSEHLADIVLVLGWTGLRWGEARAIRVGDVKKSKGHATALRVVRSHSEDYDEKTTKGGKARTVPLLGIVAPVVDRLMQGKKSTDYLLTGERGGQLWGTRFREVTKWKEVAEGRRLHDLRHTAACLWLDKGAGLATVQDWMGHASATTTNRYLHYLGTAAGEAAVAKINGSISSAWES